ncbi:enoyl-CoA hydratase/isomerase family protein [Hyphococcus lacteus]|uniref:3-hydroxyisobutyryl-CoA hydrolase n=1 Tax=Hyphococcus lacteus TaxID=3143536 RepID=A0ABV3Z730_9PROT
MTDKIEFTQIGDWGVITLQNEKALNALDWDMAKAMRAQLMKWASDKSIKAILVRGAGDRAFCAGGDIRWLHETAKNDPAHASEFFREEYRNNSLIYHYPKPYVALIDGINMGGGVGISVHGDFRVAGDATLFAMPETGIGLFPDVGGGHFMPRLHDGVGLYYALTGARAKAADCMAAGIATHYTSDDQYADLEKALMAAKLGDHAHADIEAILDRFAGDPGHAPINDLRADIKRLFSDHDTLDGLMKALSDDNSAFAADTLKTLSRMSPTSMRITFEQMKRGGAFDFDEVMKMEFRVVRRIMEGNDFFEGVRAQILDKDRNPKWDPESLDAITDEDIAYYFNELGDAELILP